MFAIFGFIIYLIINLFLLFLLFKNISLYQENQSKYDYVDIETDKSNKEWFYFLMDKYQIKGHAYQIVGKNLEHYYKEDLKIIYFGKDFFRNQTIYSIFAIFYNISLMSLLNKEEHKYYSLYLKYHKYFYLILLISFIGSFLIFLKSLFFSGIVFLLVYIFCVVFELLLANKIKKHTLNLIETELTDLNEEQKNVIKKLINNEKFYYLSVFFNKRYKEKGFD